MSSPLSSLRKAQGRKLLPHLAFSSADIGSGSARSPVVPSQSPLCDDALLNDVTSRMIKTPNGRSSQLSGRSTSTTRATPVAGPSDIDLMETMMTKIGRLEKQVVHQAKEIIEKDKRIRILEEKTSILQKAAEEKLSSPDYVKELEKRCILLQQQISEMEGFLADYGMIWVGSTSDPESDVYNKESDNPAALWHPAQSLPSHEVIDYDLILKNIGELNIVAGEGSARIQRTLDGARLKIPDPVQLVLYANGIVMFDGPFRPFSDPATQRVIRDLTDGYFPSELRHRYPDGIPFQVYDKRHTRFQPRGIQAFLGEGKVVGGSEFKESRLVLETDPSERPLGVEVQSNVETSLPQRRELTAEQFLRRLPQSVIKSGRVIDIRGSLGETLQGANSGEVGTIVVETDALKEIQSRHSTQNPSSNKGTTTLRIRSATGEHTFVLKMRATDTIGDVRRYLTNQGVPLATASYSLVTAFPNKTYDDDAQTLLDAGLVPASNLHIRPRK